VARRRPRRRWHVGCRGSPFTPTGPARHHRTLRGAVAALAVEDRTHSAVCGDGAGVVAIRAAPGLSLVERSGETQHQGKHHHSIVTLVAFCSWLRRAHCLWLVANLVCTSRPAEYFPHWPFFVVVSATRGVGDAECNFSASVSTIYSLYVSHLNYSTTRRRAWC
jgi:hypothetical protein